MLITGFIAEIKEYNTRIENKKLEAIDNLKDEDRYAYYFYEKFDYDTEYCTYEILEIGEKIKCECCSGG